MYIQDTHRNDILSMVRQFNGLLLRGMETPHVLDDKECALIPELDGETNRTKTSMMGAEVLLKRHGLTRLPGKISLVINLDSTETFRNDIQTIAEQYGTQPTYETLGNLYNSVRYPVRVIEDMHPLARKTMSEELQRYKNKRQQ